MPRKDLRPEMFHFSVTIDVRWQDMDAFQHVNHARYLTYFEVARCEYFRSLGLETFTDADGPVVLSAECRYRNQIIYPGKIRVYVRISILKEKSFHMTYAIYNEATHVLAADGETMLIWTSKETRKRTAIPEDLRKRIIKREGMNS